MGWKSGWYIRPRIKIRYYQRLLPHDLSIDSSDIVAIVCSQRLYLAGRLYSKEAANR